MDEPKDTYEVKVDRLAEAEEGEKRRRKGFIPPWLGFVFLAGVIAGLLFLLFFKGPEAIQIRESSRCMSCHGEMLAALRKKALHLPFAQLRCTACHTAHGTKELNQMRASRGAYRRKSVSVGGQSVAVLYVGGRSLVTRYDAPKPATKSKLLKQYKELCRNCHFGTMSEASMRYVMPPFAKGQCGSCHTAHASDYERLTTAPVKVMCLTCHPRIAKYYKEAILHPPFKVGSCTSCHKPHASNHKPLLRRHPKVLCFACHQPMAKYRTMPVQMQPFTQGLCPRCHNPHGSPNRKLLQMPLPTLCFSCHRKIGELQKRPVMMEPFRKGQCLRCHYPHGGFYRKLLKADLQGNELCYMCHGKYKKNYQRIGHNRVVRNASPYQPEGGVGSCLNCHEPHASMFMGLVQKEQIALCLSCHGPRRYFAHPIGIKWDDPWRGNYLRCASCHNPMGSGIVKLKRRDRDGLCVSCHQATDPAFIYYTTKTRPWHSYRIPGSEGG